MTKLVLVLAIVTIAYVNAQFGFVPPPPFGFPPGFPPIFGRFPRIQIQTPEDILKMTPANGGNVLSSFVSTTTNEKGEVNTRIISNNNGNVTEVKYTDKAKPTVKDTKKN